MQKKRLNAGCCILIVLALILWRFYNTTEIKDVQNTDILKLAKTIDITSNEIDMHLVKPLISNDTKEILIEVENTSQHNFDIPANEIVIDHFLKGKWYFWGKCGNGLERATGVLANEVVQLDYRLSTDILQDADFIETYDGKQSSKDGNEFVGISTLAIELFPGKYRIRLNGNFQDMKSEDSNINCEILYEFNVE